MKTRNGFVSNSSSNSFVIIGRPMTIEEINLENADLLCLYGYGYDDIGEGVDFFKITPEMLDFIKDRYYKFDTSSSLKFYNVYWQDPGEIISLDFCRKDFEKILDKIPANMRFGISSWEVSYHSTEKLETMIERYFPDYSAELEEIDEYVEKKQERDEMAAKVKELDLQLKDTEKKFKNNKVFQAKVKSKEK